MQFIKWVNGEFYKVCYLLLFILQMSSFEDYLLEIIRNVAKHNNFICHHWQRIITRTSCKYDLVVTYSNFISYCCLLYPQRRFHYVHLKRIIVDIISHFAFPPKSNGILTNWNMCCFINIIQCNYSVVNTHLKTVDPVE